MRSKILEKRFIKQEEAGGLILRGYSYFKGIPMIGSIL